MKLFRAATFLAPVTLLMACQQHSPQTAALQETTGTVRLSVQANGKPTGVMDISAGQKRLNMTLYHRGLNKNYTLGTTIIGSDLNFKLALPQTVDQTLLYSKANLSASTSTTGTCQQQPTFSRDDLYISTPVQFELPLKNQTLRLGDTQEREQTHSDTQQTASTTNTLIYATTDGSVQGEQRCGNTTTQYLLNLRAGWNAVQVTQVNTATPSGTTVNSTLSTQSPVPLKLVSLYPLGS